MLLGLLGFETWGETKGCASDNCDDDLRERKREKWSCDLKSLAVMASCADGERRRGTAEPREMTR